MELAIFSIGAWVGGSHGGVLAGLAACGVMMNIVSTASDLSQDFKTPDLGFTTVYKLNRAKADAFGPVVASSLIRGDGIWTLPSFVLALAKEKLEQKLDEQPPDLRNDKFVQDDVFLQVMGPKRNGRVRGAGRAIAPSDVGLVRTNEQSLGFGISVPIGHSSNDELGELKKLDSFGRWKNKEIGNRPTGVHYAHRLILFLRYLLEMNPQRWPTTKEALQLPWRSFPYK
ncbi:hypothetical protein NE237_012099 [Protea cynaroides]|uniref:Uncharacterized protein n=1 Tax=Protea cynaroides TaxID=273540 RepID=A0A9Q0GYH5_9MAGN|nr:hypothetical protein NE237_012099 [Protea cynaroides]